MLKVEQRQAKRFAAYLRGRNICDIGAIAVGVGAFALGSSLSPSAPDPNPGLNASANASEKVGMAQVGLGQQQIDLQKKYADQQFGLTKKVVDQQLQTADTNQQHANSQWDYYTNTFKPIEQKMVSDAVSYDTPAMREQKAGEAGSSVARAYAQQRQAQQLQESGMGVNPNSGRWAEMDRLSGISQAADTAGAENKARTDTQNMGWARMQDVSNFGRNMPSTASTAYATSLNAGNSAVGNNNATVNSVNSGMGVAQGWYNSANNSFGTANSGYANANKANMANYDANYQQFGDLMNFASGAGHAYAISSSKKLKTNKRKIDGAGLLKKVQDTPVEKWRYKQGAGDGGEHIGPYAEDMQKNFGVGDGKTINPIDHAGITMAAVAALSKKVDRLAAGLKKQHGRRA